jgi:hypothetical protein
MPRLIVKYEKLSDIHHLHEVVKAWEKGRPPVKSLKLSYQREGMECVVYDKGWQDAVIVEFALSGEAQLNAWNNKS